MKKLFYKWFPRLFKPSWRACTRASCWDGKNAVRRMMNAASPHMPEERAREYTKWQRKRGCDTAHLILANKADGEFGGYSIYGPGKPDWNIDKSYATKMLNRVRYHRRKGFGVILWLLTDDSTDWNRAILADPERYVNDLHKLGFFRYASAIVLGLEMTEYPDRPAFERLAAAIRKVDRRMRIGTHHNSNRADYAAIGDILFYQVSPGQSAAQIRSATSHALTHGKPVNFFELSRGPARELCEAALESGAYAVGNW